MLHTLRLTLPNVFLIIGERAVLVDSGGPKDVPRILSFLQAHGIGNGKVALILLTHGHWDHAGGAAELRATTGAPVAIHRGDADLARRGTNGTLTPTSLMGQLIRPFFSPDYPPLEPDLVIDDEIDLAEFGVAARVLWTPGHTPGSVSIRTDEGDIIVGDLLMGGFLGGWFFPSVPRLHYFADDLTQVRASVQKVMATSPRLVHCGHGGPLAPDAVARRFGV